MSPIDTIKELNYLDDIDSIEEEYKMEFGKDAFNISNWNSCEEFKHSIIDLLVLQNDVDSLDYIFSYEQVEKRVSGVLAKLGIDENKATLFTHSGSASIFNVLNLLKMNGVKKIVILCPVYFTVIHSCNILNIDYELVYIERENNSYVFDENKFKEIGDKSVAYWITNPIYCTSVYYNSKQISVFNSLSESNFTVFDESLCLLEHLIGPRIKSEKAISLYSPHKAICMNGIKFSLITTNEKFQSQLDAWSDVLCGCLSCSNQMAINHFLSNSFMNYKKAFDKMIDNNFQKLKDILKRYDHILYDNNAQGYLITLFFKNIDANQGLSISFNKNILYKTGVRFIPGIRNHFSNSMNFCFRVNLSVLATKDYYYVERLLKYLSEFK